MITGLPLAAQILEVSKEQDISSSQIPTLKSTVDRVDVDIVVSNSKGAFVSGLTQGDFVVEEDSVLQPVRTFQAHTVAAEGSSATTKVPQLPPDTFLNLESTPDSGTPTVLLFDVLSTPFDLQDYAREQLVKFIRERRSGTPIAIFVLGARLRLLQGFTENTRLLTQALATRETRDRGLALHASSDRNDITRGGSVIDSDLTFQQILGDFTAMARRDEAFIAQRRAETRLHALIELGRFLNDVPGRKNLIWLAASFDAGIFRSQDPHLTARYNAQTLSDFRTAGDMFSLSHTTIYPVDVNGVRAILGYSKYGVAENAGRLQMDAIADATGGHAFYGTNDLREAMDQAVSRGSSYYSLTYAPTNATFDGSLRHIKVTLKKGGYNLAYRRTYYADDLSAAARAAADAPEGPLTPALERGTPLEHGLLVEAHLEADGPPVAATAAQAKMLAQYASMQQRAGVAGPVRVAAAGPVMMQVYTITYGLIARQVEMPGDEAGVHTASLEFGVLAYDDDGRKLSGVDTRIEDAIPAVRYAKVSSDGYHGAQQVAVPVTAALLRLAVRDVRGNRVGSLEVKLPLVGAARP